MFILPFSTKRINAQMRELTVRQAVDLCQIPDHLNELGIGRALNAIVAETNLPLETWTVQERYAAIGHYITALEQGDWQVSDNAMYSDYTTDKDYPEQGYTFQESDGTTLEIVPLTGEYAEACERAVASMGTAAGNWVVAVMAATIRLQGSDWDGTPDAFVQENITRLMDMPESDFARLHQHFQQAWFEQAHGFDLGFDGDGIFVIPNQKGGVGLLPVRFPFIACVGEATAQLWRTMA